MGSLDGMITHCADTLWKAPDRTGDREMYVHHDVMESGGRLGRLLIYDVIITTNEHSIKYV